MPSISLKSSKPSDLSSKEPDLYVTVVVNEGFALPPEFKDNFKPVFMQPKKVTVELWDAMTKKQLLLCTFTRFWGGAGASEYCRETLVNELKRAFLELNAKRVNQNLVPLPVTDEAK